MLAHHLAETLAQKIGQRLNPSLADGVELILRASLTKSITPEVGSGAFTYSNASAQSFTDAHGDTLTGAAGEAVFDRMHRIEQCLTYSEDFTNAAWTTTGTAPVKTDMGNHLLEVFNPETNRYETRLMKVVRLTGIDADGNRILQDCLGADSVDGEVFTGQWCVWTDATDTGKTVQLVLRAQSDTVGQVSRNVALTERPTLWALGAFTGAAGQTGIKTAFNPLASGIATAYFAYASVQRVTGQSDTTPSGYVATTDAARTVYVPWQKRSNVFTAGGSYNRYEIVHMHGRPVGDCDASGRYHDYDRNIGAFAPDASRIWWVEGGASQPTNEPDAFDVIYISAGSGNDSNGGTGWGDAYATLDKLDAITVNNNTTVLIDEGNYEGQRCTLLGHLDVRFRARYPGDSSRWPVLGYREILTVPSWKKVDPADYDGAYSGATTYGVGAIVSYAGSNYFSHWPGNTGNQPDISPDWWDNVDNVYEGAHSEGAPSYMAMGDIEALAIRRPWDTSGNSNATLVPAALFEYAVNAANTKIFIFSDTGKNPDDQFGTFYYGTYASDAAINFENTEGCGGECLSGHAGAQIVHHRLTGAAISTQPYAQNYARNFKGNYMYTLARCSSVDLGYHYGLWYQQFDGEDMGCSVAMFGGSHGMSAMLDMEGDRGGLSESFGMFYSQQRSDAPDASSLVKSIWNCRGDTYTYGRRFNDGSIAYHDRDSETGEIYFVQANNSDETGIRSNTKTGSDIYGCWGTGNVNAIRVSDGAASTGVNCNINFVHFKDCKDNGLEVRNTGTQITVTMRNFCFEGDGSAGSVGVNHKNDSIVVDDYDYGSVYNFETDENVATAIPVLLTADPATGFTIDPDSILYRAGEAVNNQPGGIVLYDQYLTYPTTELFEDITELGEFYIVFDWMRDDTATSQQLMAIGKGAEYFNTTWLGAGTIRIRKVTVAGGTDDATVTIPTGTPADGERVRCALSVNSDGIAIAANGAVATNADATPIPTSPTELVVNATFSKGSPADGQHSHIDFYRGNISSENLRLLTA